jgi:spermidine synthase
VPSFGEWGYVIAARNDYQRPERLPEGLRYLTLTQLPSLFDFPNDMSTIPAEINRLNDQALVRYYEEDWKKLTH